MCSNPHKFEAFGSSGIKCRCMSGSHGCVEVLCGFQQSAYIRHCCQVDVYDGTAEFLRKLELDNDALTKAIIGTIGDIDAYQLPDAKGHTAFMRHLLRVTDAERQQRREQILSTSLKDFR